MKEDVLYLEADEEITAAIDRVNKLKADHIKIVVPKRSTLLQSIVNLKLLKRAAEDAGKAIILVTSDRTATHLAGRVGLAVAPTLKSEAVLPEVPKEAETSDTVEAEEEGPPDEAAVDDAAAAAATAEMVAPSNQPKSSKPSYATPMMVRKPVEGEAADAAVDSSVSAKEKKVPDFNAMQKRLLLLGGAVVVIILLFVLNYFIKSAKVTIYAKGTKVSTSFPFSVDPAAKTSDPATAVLAGATLQSSHDLTANATATGTKDVGTKASGSISIKNCYNSSDFTLPAGTKFTANGKNFLSTADAPVTGGHVVGGACVSAGTGTAQVVAEQNGGDYNLAQGTNFSVSGYPSSSASGLYGIGSQMSGGTSKTVSVVSQGDIDKAKADALTKDKDVAEKDLENKVASGSQALPGSFTQTTGAVTSVPAVGAEGSTATVTISVAYSELSVVKSDLENVVKAQEQKQVTDQNQIYDDGLGSATITPTAKDPLGRQSFSFVTDAFAGAKIDPKAVVALARGKKYGDAADQVSKLPGVDRDEISLFPFWSVKLPSIASHIKVDIKVASQ